MPFQLFHTLFPDAAERETRSIMVLPESNLGLPACSYSFLEMFCDEPGCDCRRVFFTVVSSDRKNIEAVVAWGWENRNFYRKWLKYGSEIDVDCLKGPILNPGSQQSELAPMILNLVNDILLRDQRYIKRIKKHYSMFRQQIDEREIRSNLD